jgi:hypothetical protein
MAGPSEQLLVLADLPRASDPLQAAIIPAVVRHLRARALLSLAILDGARAEASMGLAAWDGVAAAIGDAPRAQEMRGRAATIAGVMSAYAEDAPDDWPPHPSQEGLLRFAFAAARLPATLDIV